MFINNIEIKIDSQVPTPMGCMISPPAYDILIFSKIILFIIVQPNVEELSTNLQVYDSCRYNNQRYLSSYSIAVQLLSTIISASSAVGSLTLLDCFCFITYFCILLKILFDLF
jgi:hypothetical protein